MNLAHPEKVVLLGFLSHFPVAGVAWQTLHYLSGFQRLGYDVYYVEAHGCTPSKLMQNETDDGAALAAAYIASIMERFGLADHWAYHAPYPEARFFGMSDTRLKALYDSAALLINLHGSHLPTPELTATNRLVYLGTDPVDVEVDLFNQRQETIDYLAPHCAFFTYGENLGRADCQVPVPERFTFKPTRQPVVMDFWEHCGRGDAAIFTTIGNWRQADRQVHFKGGLYRWSKHFEFRKFIDLPRRVQQPFELALASYDEADRRFLEDKGWRVRPALDFSLDLDAYRRYIGESRAEFTVAKDQNVRLRSGWFSDRSATYLAAGRPVITQDTGFNNILPTGEGLFSFSTMEGILAAVEAINSDYERQRRAALTIARECFSHDVVLGGLLRELGLSRPAPTTKAACETETAPASDVSPNSMEAVRRTRAADDAVTSPAAVPFERSQSSPIPQDLVVRPISRWPTRLPDETIRFASSLLPPAAARDGCAQGRRASIIIVTHGGLPFTKLCVAALFSSGWSPNDELIIVDNASSDGTPAYLRELARLNPFVRVILNEQNRGFASANNQALALASGDVLILLNGDTLVPRGWRAGLLRWLEEPDVGLVGPVTNRTCNEAQIDSPYKTFGEFEQFARERARTCSGVATEIPMLALFCAALRRDVLAQVGPLDEQFEIGMFEDDDFAERMRAAGFRLVCAEEVFVHHFGQASLGELCVNGNYDRVLDANRARFEAKWGRKWQPHGRRISPEYRLLRERIRLSAAAHLARGATVMVISKGDDELLKLGESSGWHFPQREDGQFANLYPADSAAAIAHLETLRSRGARYLLIPKPALWWLEHYGAFKEHLESRYQPVLQDEQTCVIFDVGGTHA